MNGVRSKNTLADLSTYVPQDEECNATGRIAAFDPFRTPTHALPLTPSPPPPSLPPSSTLPSPRPRHRRAHLPRFWVAPLEAGGCPLLSPPNLPHLVLTVRDCVVVEERRVSLWFLDEVTSFLRRASLWRTLPILYPLIRGHDVDGGATLSPEEGGGGGGGKAASLCDPEMLDRHVVTPMLDLLLRFQAQTQTQQQLPREEKPEEKPEEEGNGEDKEKEKQVSAPNVSHAVAACARQSLAALMGFKWQGARFEEMGLDASLLRPNQASLAKLQAHAHLIFPPSDSDNDGSEGAFPWFTRRHGRHLRAAKAMAANLEGVLSLRGHRHGEEGGGGGGDSSGGGSGGGNERRRNTSGVEGEEEEDCPLFACVVHEGGGRAVWGPARDTASQASEDRFVLTLAMERDSAAKAAAESEAESEAGDAHSTGAPGAAGDDGSALVGTERRIFAGAALRAALCELKGLGQQGSGANKGANGASGKEEGNAHRSPSASSAVAAAKEALDGLFGEDSDDD